MTIGLNRRKSVRIVDRILLSYQRVSQKKYNTVAEDLIEGIPLYNHEGLADIQMYIGAQNALAKLRERDQDLADFLKHLDTKMNLILQQMKGEKSPFDDLTLKKVTLSANGMAFVTQDQMSTDDFLEFHVVLLPAYTYIYCLGKVISCEKEPEEGKFFQVAVEFTLLMDDDREKLIQHNFKQQSLALRNRRREP